MSARRWTSGVERVAKNVFRIPLPIPDAALRAVNVYAVVADTGAITLIDAGWDHPDTFACLRRSMADVGLDITRLERVLVTHSHADHYSLAARLREQYGANVGLGVREAAELRAIRAPGNTFPDNHYAELRAAGADRVIRLLSPLPKQYADSPGWVDPDFWIRDDELIDLGGRKLRAVHTPGHTVGHVVFVEEQAGLVFTGDHVLPHITPSIAFELTHSHLPLEQFLDSLDKLRRFPARIMMPAHGPAGSDVHGRVASLFAHHERRLAQTERALHVLPAYTTAYEVAEQLHWTRRERALKELSPVHQMLAVSETVAHLDLLVARDRAYRFDGTPVRYLPTSVVSS